MEFNHIDFPMRVFDPILYFAHINTGEEWENQKPVGKTTSSTCSICGAPLEAEQQRCPVCKRDRVWFDEYVPNLNLVSAGKITIKAGLERLARHNHYLAECPSCQTRHYFHLMGTLRLLKRLRTLPCPQCGTILNATLQKLPKHAYKFHCWVDGEMFDIFRDESFENFGNDWKDWPVCPICTEELHIYSQLW